MGSIFPSFVSPLIFISLEYSMIKKQIILNIKHKADGLRKSMF